MIPETAKIIALDQFDLLIQNLSREQYRLAGPVLRNGAITCDYFSDVSELPQGWRDVQQASSYRLVRRDDAMRFGFVVGPQSWKKLLYPPEISIWNAQRTRTGFKLDSPQTDALKTAFVGVRPCELHAILSLDSVFTSGSFQDPAYRSRREGTFILAVNCTEPGANCFCASMGTGPKAAAGFDLSLTEILNENRHYFVVEVGSEKGAQLLTSVEAIEANEKELQQAEKSLAWAVDLMGKTIKINGLKESLQSRPEHPEWDRVGVRCLACGNCTLVCPTCFCTTVEDHTDLTGGTAERIRKWDSCFTSDFSYIFGGCVRTTTMSRYRQWLTHKLANWGDQFPTHGCVGCGRCITWCPVGIDITEEAKIIQK